MTRSRHRAAPDGPARLRTIAVAVASALAGSAWANPSGPSVAAGAASFSTSGNTLSVTNAPGTIINWQQFSIRPDEVTRFIQSGAMSAVLNRVTGAEHSQLLGQLLSNGRVFLINPNGVTIGAGATIDTAGFLASSLNISDGDFLSGRMRFQALGGDPGKVVNQGAINAHSGGSIYLIAPTVENHGVTTAPNGDVLLAAGRSVEAVASASPHIRVEINAPAAGEAVNVGQVVGGRIGIYGGLVRNAGTLSATTAMVGENGNIVLKATGDVRLESGTVKAAAVDGGAIRIEGDRVVQGAAIDASGAQGGTVTIQANTVMQGARVDARGTGGKGGVIDVQSGGSLVQTAETVLDASGATAGGSITVQGTGERRVFSSATLDATSASGAGGGIEVLGGNIVLAGAKVDASGATGGGRVLVGGDFHGANPDVPNARFVTVTGTTAIAADARHAGNGGDVVVWADDTASFAGAITARGGMQSGDGGRVEVSGKQAVRVSGHVDASAPRGTAGTLLIDPKNITIEAVAPAGNPVLELNDPTPGPNENFGQDYVVVNGTHAVVTDPADNGGFGAAYVFDVAPASPTQGQLLSAIVGSTGTDQVGSGGIQVLASGNVIVRSPGWSSNGTLLAAGAMTFGAMNAATPTFAAGGGVVSAGNSLVGGEANAAVAAAGLNEFVSGTRFALVNPGWNGGRGAVTFGDAFAGMPVGVLSNVNSIVGPNANDQAGVGGLTTVGGGSGVVVASHFWNSSRGAVTYVPMTAPLATPGDGTIAPIAGTTGDITAGNSLTGAQPSQFVGSGGVTPLSNGNYFVASPGYSGAGGTETAAGAVTWVNGASGIAFGETVRGAVVSGANSIRGNAFDQVGSGGITELIGAASGNVVIGSLNWGGGLGASTWVDGATGAAGTVSATNSLTGSTPGDFASQSVAPLSNGNYVLLSPAFANNGGAATLVAGAAGGGGQPIVNGSTQPITPVSASNSLLGAGPNAFVNASVQELFDGATGVNNVYALFTPGWNDNAGAITLAPIGGPGAGPVGAIDATTSLIGSVSGASTGDNVGSVPVAYGVGAGRYFLASPQWSNGGAAPFAGAMTPIDLNAGPVGRPTGAVGAGNSIVGQTPFESIDPASLRVIGVDRWVLLTPGWDNGAAADAGAIRLIDASTPSFVTTAVGALTPANSLVGTNANDRVGSLPLDDFGGLQQLSGGDFLIASPDWNDGRGALTFFTSANAATRLTGVVDASNSLLGTTGGGSSGDRIGTDNPDGDVTRVNDLGAGFYAVRSVKWHNGAAAEAGAVTLVNTSTGTPTGPISDGTGVVGTNNSIVGTTAGDFVGEALRDLGGGRFAIASYLWDNGAATDAGAVTLASTAAWSPAIVGAGNSLVGAQANDQVGLESTVVGGRLVVLSPNWSNGAAASAGAVTVLDPATFVSGTVSPANSLVGTTANDQVGNFGATLLSTQPDAFYVTSPSWANAAGAVTFMSALAPATGAVSAANSLVGAAPGDGIGNGGAYALPNGNLLLRSPDFNAGAGALTFVNAAGAPPAGVVGAANSLVGVDGVNNSLHSSGQYDIRTLSSGGYIVVNTSYNAGGGMIVYGSPTTGVVGTPGPVNGWIGAPGDGLGQHIELLAGNEFVFNAPFAAKGADAQAGRLYIAKPGALGGVPFNGTMLFGDPGSDPAPTVISAAQIAGFLDGGTQVLLQASNDIVVNAAIDASVGTATSGLLRMQAGRSILVNANITNLNQDGANQSIHLTANDAAATGVRDAGPGELRMAPGTQITGGGNVRLEVGEGTGPGSAGGITLATVAGANVDVLNTATNPVPDPNRSVDFLPGTISSASNTFNIVADGDVRFGPLGGAGATVQGGLGTVDVTALGALTGGTGTLIDLFTPGGIGPVNLTAASIGTSANAFGLQHGSQGVNATATAGGVHIAQTAGTTDTAFYTFDAPAGQNLWLGAPAGAMNVAGTLAPVNGNPLRLYTAGGDISLLVNPTITASTVELIAGPGQIVVPAGATINGTLIATSGMSLQGGTTTLNGAATLSGLAITGNGTVLDIGAGPVTVGSLGWGQAGTPEINTLTGTGGTLTVTNDATIQGDGTRSLNSVALRLANGAAAQYTAGAGAFNMLGTASITNDGSFTLGNDNAFASPATALNAFTNNGTLSKLAGTGTTTIGGPVGQIAFTNAGSVQIGSGRIALANGSTLNGPVNVAAGAGLDLTGGAHAAGGTIAGPGSLTLTNATLTANAAVGTATTQVNTGAVLTANNALTGQLDILGGTANLNGVANTTGVTVTAGALNVGGALTTQTYSQSGGTATGPGDLAIQQAYTRLAGAFGGFDDLAINQAAGNLDATGLAAVSSIALAAPGGTLTVPTPLAVTGLAKLSGGSVALNADVTAGAIELVGPNVQLGSVTLTGPVNALGASVVVPDNAAVTFAGGGTSTLRDLTVGGNGTSLTLSGATDVVNSFLWQGGSGTSTIAGAALNVAGTAAIGGDGTHVLDGVQMTNAGSMQFGPTFGAGGPLLIQNGAVLANAGLLDIQNDQPIRSDAGVGTLRNTGGMVKSGAGGSTVLGGGTGTFVFDNQGSVQINSGQLVVTGSGTQSGSFAMAPGGGLVFASGTHVLTGSISGGTLGVSGTANVTIAGALTANLMDIAGGVLDIDGAAATNLYNQTGGVVGGTGDLSVAASFSQSGGSFGNTFNTLSVTQASGDIDGAGFGAVGKLALAAPTGAVNITTPLTLAGAASFFGGTGINVSAPVTAASVGMVTGGTARISNATVQATSGAISVSAGQVEVTAGSAPAGLVAAGGLSVVSTGDVVVQGGSGADAYAELNAGTGPLAMSVQRDLKISGGSGAGAYALVTGDPDVGSDAVPVKVGGVIAMQEGTGSGATARIESASPSSIYVLFPNLATGGYTVNGQEATSLNGSGFYAGGVPAILDQNLFIDYGLKTVQQFDPGVLVTAMNQATDPLGEANDDQERIDLRKLFEDIDDAPVCK